MVRAIARASTVLAVPGTSSRRTWPPHVSAAMTSRISSGLPCTTVSTLSRKRPAISNARSNSASAASGAAWDSIDLDSTKGSSLETRHAPECWRKLRLVEAFRGFLRGRQSVPLRELLGLRRIRRDDDQVALAERIGHDLRGQVAVTGPRVVAEARRLERLERERLRVALGLVEPAPRAVLVGKEPEPRGES